MNFVFMPLGSPGYVNMRFGRYARATRIWRATTYSDLRRAGRHLLADEAIEILPHQAAEAPGVKR